MSLFSISREEIIKRLKSFLWRVVMMVASVVIAFILENLNVLNLPPTAIAVIGLVLGEISKTINQNLQVLKGQALKGLATGESKWTEEKV